MSKTWRLEARGGGAQPFVQEVEAPNRAQAEAAVLDIMRGLGRRFHDWAEICEVFAPTYSSVTFEEVKPGHLGQPLAPTPFHWRDPTEIPARPWLLGRWLLRGTVTAIVAPGGMGKSLFVGGLALSIATGRPLLGKSVFGGASKAWLWNLEDDADELSRVLQAGAARHGIAPSDLADVLYVDSGMSGMELCTAIIDEAGFRIVRPVMDAVETSIREQGISCLTIDPFVSSHDADENNNAQIDRIVKEWAQIASRTGCAVVLVHHARKSGGGRIVAELSRGATSLIAACRSALVLNRMERDEAERFGIASDAERRRLFTVQDDKHNRAPAEEAEWFRIESQLLGNGGIEGGDSVGVALPWAPAKPADTVGASDQATALAAVAAGEWRKDVQASAWVGRPIADALSLDLDEPSDRTKVKAIIREWLRRDLLVEVDRPDQRRRMKTFIETAQPAQPLVEQCGAGGPLPCSTTTTPPFRGEVGGAAGGGDENIGEKVEQESERE